MSEKSLDTRGANGAGHGGPARGYSWESFKPGNTVSLRHGLYATKFQMLEGEEEIAETADLLRALLPIYASAFEPALQLLSARLWRLKRAYEFIESTPEDELSKSFLETLGSLENLVNRSLAALGMTPVAASEIGVNLAKLAAGSEDGRPPFEWNNLDVGERRTLERLLAKGRRAGGGDGA